VWGRSEEGEGRNIANLLGFFLFLFFTLFAYPHITKNEKKKNICFFIIFPPFLFYVHLPFPLFLLRIFFFFLLPLLLLLLFLIILTRTLV
jgi:hypothetical protein